MWLWNIDIKSNQVKENIIEVEISLFLNPTIREKEIIETKIVYSTLVEFEKKSDNKEEVEKIILIKTICLKLQRLKKKYLFYH